MRLSGTGPVGLNTLLDRVGQPGASPDPIAARSAEARRHVVPWLLEACDDGSCERLAPLLGPAPPARLRAALRLLVDEAPVDTIEDALEAGAGERLELAIERLRTRSFFDCSSF